MDFRPTHRELTDAEKAMVDAIKRDASTLGELLCRCAPNREISLAKTKLEEAVMWAVKGITG